MTAIKATYQDTGSSQSTHIKRGVAREEIIQKKAVRNIRKVKSKLHKGNHYLKVLCFPKTSLGTIIVNIHTHYLNMIAESFSVYQRYKKH